MRARGGWLLIGALAIAGGCQRGGELRLDWLRDGEAARRLPERTRFTPDDLQGAYAQGFQRARETTSNGTAFRWSRSGRSQLVLEVIDATAQRLRLEGFPVPRPDGAPQTVDVVFNDEWIAQLEWDGAARRELVLPEGVVVPGRNTLELNYGQVVQPSVDLSGSSDARRLAMAWTEIALLGGVQPAAEVDSDPAIQRSSSLLVRWTPLIEGSRWSGEGVALERGAEFALWMDPGDGRWRELRHFQFAAGERVQFEERLDLGSGEVERCGIAMLDGGVRWQSLATHHRTVGERPPIVLVTLDTTRRDALGSYAPGARTPTLDRLAAEGVVFDRAYSVAPVTAPTHASIFLSDYPSAHGLTNNGRNLAPIRGNHLLAQAKAWGYRSAGFVSLGVLSSDLGFAQGFDHFDHHFDQGWWRFAAELNPPALRWIAEHPQGETAVPGFLWVHYADPHKPYGRREEDGQGLVLELNGEPLGVIPTMGLLRFWELSLPAGRSELVLRAPQQLEDDREHWYVLRDVRVVDGETAFEFGAGWEEIRGYRRMREWASFVLQSEEPRTVQLRMIVEDLPTVAEARRRYADEVEAVDAALGELMDALEAAGWLERGIVAVVADHGEDLGEGGHFGHVEHVGDTLMRIPWILWSSPLSAARVDAPVSVIDVAPTLWSLAGLPPDPQWRGVDALRATSTRSLLLETFPPEAERHWRGVVRGGDVLRLLETDSGWRLEGEQVGPTRPQLEIDTLLQEWQVVAPLSEQEISAEVEERLRALGYIR